MTQTTYTDEIGEEICRRLAEGESLRSILKSEGMPARSTFHQWAHRHEKFREQYVFARQFQGDNLAEEALEIGDELLKKGLFEPHEVMLARLRVDTRKWYAGKMHPRMYGDRVTQEHVGEGGGPIKVQAVDFTDDELAAIAARGRD